MREKKYELSFCIFKVIGKKVIIQLQIVFFIGKTYINEINYKTTIFLYVL